jgi:hypothetical protein
MKDRIQRRTLPRVASHALLCIFIQGGGAPICMLIGPLLMACVATKMVDMIIVRHPNRIRARGAETYCSTTFLSSAETNPENATAPTICQTSMNP